MLHIHLRRRSYKFITITFILLIIMTFQFYLYREYRAEIKGFLFLLCSYSYTINDKRIMFDSPSFSIHHYPEFVCPQNFRNMADWIYGWPEHNFNEKVENSVTRIHATVAYLPYGSILYIKTDSLSDFFSNIYPNFRNKFVLITGQGDGVVPGPHLHYLEENNSKIIHWFGQNGDIDASKSKRFTHIPIGKNMLVIYAAIEVYT